VGRPEEPAAVRYDPLLSGRRPSGDLHCASVSAVLRASAHTALQAEAWMMPPLVVWKIHRPGQACQPPRRPRARSSARPATSCPQGLGAPREGRRPWSVDPAGDRPRRPSGGPGTSPVPCRPRQHIPERRPSQRRHRTAHERDGHPEQRTPHYDELRLLVDPRPQRHPPVVVGLDDGFTDRPRSPRSLGAHFRAFAASRRSVKARLRWVCRSSTGSALHRRMAIE